MRRVSVYVSSKPKSQPTTTRRSCSADTAAEIATKHQVSNLPITMLPEL
jgi:hypothetical protein